jgi:hypothetical protein
MQPQHILGSGDDKNNIANDRPHPYLDPIMTTNSQNRRNQNACDDNTVAAGFDVF